MDHSLWTILILYGVVQGVILSVTVFLKEKSLYLSLFFANISYLLFIYIFERFEWFREQPHLIWTNVPSWFLIGPLLYLYVKSAFKPAEEKAFGAQPALHFIPALGVLIYFWDFYFGMSGAEKIAAFTSFYSDVQIIDYVQFLYLAQISAYIYAAYRIVSRQSDWVGQEFSNSDFIRLDEYLSARYSAQFPVCLSGSGINGIHRHGLLYVLQFLSLSQGLAINGNGC